MSRSKSRLLVSAAALLALGGCDKVELFGLYVANLGTEAVVKAPWPIEIPFEDHNGRIVLEASVNGSKPVGFLLDTSAPLVSLLEPESARPLFRNIDGANRPDWQGGANASFGIRRDGLEIDFGGLSLKDQTALGLPASELSCPSNKANPSLGGVIGHDIFRRFVVEVDRDRSVIRLHDPAAYRYSGKGQVVPISVEERQPYVEALITPANAASYSARLQLDTGADVEAAFGTRSTSHIVSPTGSMRSTCSVPREAALHPGPPITIRLTDQIVLSAASDASRRKVLAAGQDGRLGARLLARFNIVFDYPHERLILEPRGTPVIASGNARASGPKANAPLLRNAS